MATQTTKPQLQLPSQALTKNIGYGEKDLPSRQPVKQQSSQTFHAFQLEKLGLLLPENTISELLNEMLTCRLPNTSQVLYGMGNLRGRIIPVFNLWHLFGMPQREIKYFLVIGSGDESVAILLDTLPQTVEIDEQDRLSILPPMPDSLSPYVNNVYQVNGVWVDCNMSVFFNSLQGYLR